MRLHKFQTADRADMFIDLDRVEAILDHNTQNGSICTLLGLSCGIFYTVKGTYLEIAKLVQGEVHRPDFPAALSETVYRFPTPGIIGGYSDVELLDLKGVDVFGADTRLVFKDRLRPSLITTTPPAVVEQLIARARGS